jgi:hypothetical protein
MHKILAPAEHGLSDIFTSAEQASIEHALGCPPLTQDMRRAERRADAERTLRDWIRDPPKLHPVLQLEIAVMLYPSMRVWPQLEAKPTAIKPTVQKLSRAAELLQQWIIAGDEVPDRGRVPELVAIGRMLDKSGVDIDRFATDLRKVCSSLETVKGTGGRPPDDALNTLMHSAASIFKAATGECAQVSDSVYLPTRYGGCFFVVARAVARAAAASVGEEPLSDSQLGPRLIRLLDTQKPPRK